MGFNVSQSTICKVTGNTGLGIAPRPVRPWPDQYFTDRLLFVTYFRSTMSQQRMNNVMVLHIHKHLTDSVNLKDTLNEFVTANDERRKH
jgi:hypothetical protein